ncbi:DEKNAAC103496 [Brettanomyces naardenensis]|uniref:DEKNAAC103496 n=1 Tax=Brettanomyces naardenensis TaxID=13370 RepID=A0A448YNU7_BRENA|nr:DEKNAAC103496 [Brettanomyces naardenensis]
MTCFVNARRMRAGRQPLVSRYLAPPSYYQSETQYQGNQPQLPTYTEEANPMQDVGYYDAQGNFVPAKPGEPGMPPQAPAPGEMGYQAPLNGPEDGVNHDTVYSGLSPAHLDGRSPVPDISGTTSVSYAGQQGSSGLAANGVDSGVPAYNPPPGPPPPAHPHSKF